MIGDTVPAGVVWVPTANAQQVSIASLNKPATWLADLPSSPPEANAWANSCPAAGTPAIPPEDISAAAAGGAATYALPAIAFPHAVATGSQLAAVFVPVSLIPLKAVRNGPEQNPGGVGAADVIS